MTEKNQTADERRSTQIKAQEHLQSLAFISVHSCAFAVVLRFLCYLLFAISYSSHEP
jgi:hypothetical protein